MFIEMFSVEAFWEFDRQEILLLEEQIAMTTTMTTPQSVLGERVAKDEGETAIPQSGGWVVELVEVTIATSLSKSMSI
jgi:hypothetical protein